MSSRFVEILKLFNNQLKSCARHESVLKEMKKFVNVFSLMAAVVCMAAFASCSEKEKTDYRDAWVGAYVGDSQCHTVSGDGQFSADTVYVGDTLSVSKAGNAALLIGYKGQEFQVSCTEEGSFGGENYPHGSYQGRIYGDSVFFKAIDSWQGNTVTNTFYGRKK